MRLIRNSWCKNQKKRNADEDEKFVDENKSPPERQYDLEPYENTLYDFDELGTKLYASN